MCCPGLGKIVYTLGLGMEASLVWRVFLEQNMNFQLERRKRTCEGSKEVLRQMQGVLRLHVQFVFDVL